MLFCNWLESKESSDSKFERDIYTIELSSLSSGVEELGGDVSSVNNDLNLTKTETGTFKLNAFMEGNKEESIDPAEDEFGMMKKMFEGLGTSIRVHTPAVSHNGKKKGGAVL